MKMPIKYPYMYSYVKDKHFGCYIVLATMLQAVFVQDTVNLTMVRVILAQRDFSFFVAKFKTIYTFSLPQRFEPDIFSS